ncbi:MAG: phosphatidylglycerophosphatase A, partial [Phycisphaerales bacterium]|nr:phosphatidylglycerophosphatase A [Phycisphaerales bacterium]
MSADRPCPCARVFRDPVHFLALGFGSGCAPKAPGTFGTLAAIPLYLLAQPLSLWAYLALTILGFVVGIWLCDRTARDLGV